LVVCDEVEFICIYYVECGASDGVGVVWEGFYAASVAKVYLGFLWFKSDACWEVVGECGYAS